MMTKNRSSVFPFSLAAQFVPLSLEDSEFNSQLPLMFFLLEQLQPSCVVICGGKSVESLFQCLIEASVEFVENAVRFAWHPEEEVDSSKYIEKSDVKILAPGIDSLTNFLPQTKSSLVINFCDDSTLIQRLISTNQNISECSFSKHRLTPTAAVTGVLSISLPRISGSVLTLDPAIAKKIINVFDTFEEYLEVLGDRLVLRANQGKLENSATGVSLIVEKESLESQVEQHSTKLNVLYSMIKAQANTHVMQDLTRMLAHLDQTTRTLLAEYALSIKNTINEAVSTKVRVENVSLTGISNAEYDEVLLIRESGIFDEVYYLKNNPDLIDCNMDLIEHYVRHGAAEDRSPHFLFNQSYYRKQIPETSQPGLTPLGDCLIRKGSGALNPHPLFNAQFYLAQFDEVVDGLIPFQHFVQYGGSKGISPHPNFDSAYYLKEHPEIAARGLNPLIHYLQYGSAAGFKPNPLFSPTVYSIKYPDIISAGCEPLQHYVEYGQFEGRGCKEKPIEDFAAYLPIVSSEVKKETFEVGSVSVDVIIPVYRDLECTMRCLESVIAGQDKVSYRIVVVNDCTPESELADYLCKLSKDSAILLIENKQNLGFVVSVNIGMSSCLLSDVILLNSDTVVPKGWVDNLVRQSYASENIGTACPFSNNATICNFPTFAGFNEFPGESGVQELHDACLEANYGRSVELPTAVGSCMYIKRACLNEIGLFDADTWGAGYGEECDFSMRAAMAGWKHILATDTFVFHEGEKSFKESAQQRKREATAIMNKLYSDYEAKCQKFFSVDPAKSYRVAAITKRLKRSSKPVHLYVEHGLGGGVKRAIEDEIRATSDLVTSIIFRPCRIYHDEFDTEISSADPRDGLHLILRSVEDRKFIFDILKACGVERLKVHHTMGLPFSIKEIVDQLQVPFDLVVHDYYYICPQVTLFSNEGKYCGEPELDGCSGCLAARPVAEAPDILWWRQEHKYLFEKADKITAPSQDCASRVQKYFPTSVITAKPHEPELYRKDLSILRIPGGSPLVELRVAILGVLALHKGAALVQEVINQIKYQNLPIKVKLIGTVESGLIGDSIEQTGRYVEDKLLDLINEYDPHLIWFPSLCPETYSFTLSAALSTSRPILATDFGAFSERLEGRAWSWLYSVNSQSFKIVEFMQTIIRSLHDAEYRPLVKDEDVRKPAKRALDNLFNINRNVKPKLFVIPEQFGKWPSPCAYIRALLPFSHPTILNEFSVTVGTVDELRTNRPDLVFTQRIAITDHQDLAELFNITRSDSAKLIFDIDDNLLEVPDHHPDHKAYVERAKIVTELISESSIVWASTDYLKTCISTYNDQVLVVPNALDERLWVNLQQQTCPGSWASQPLRILYMGTRTHDDDFEMIRPAFRELYHKWGNAFILEVLGVVNSNDQEDWYRPVISSGNRTQTYPAFVTWLREVNQYHVGISPLCDSHFSRSKSAIKYLDYSALGLVSVLSDVEPYRSIVKHEKNGMLVKNSTEAWFDALDYLLSHELERGMMRWSAYTNLRANHTLRRINAQRIDNLNRIIGKEPSNFEREKILCQHS